MDYQVIARKYRPQTFSEVVGQGVISRTLTNAITKGRIAHGFLFTGPSGVGKTTMARILAKALCCEHGPTATPCGTCEHCVAIAASTHPDVYEIDAATHTGVDDVRDLAEGATYAPTMARFRVYVLDECHMLSKSAWNALLKLIEEPPPHVYFVFATTEVDQVPATVANRCQRFDFRAIDRDDIISRLRDVVSGEQVNVDDAMLGRIALAAGGGMREAQTILDQLIAMCDQTVTDEDLDLLLGAARSEDLHTLLRQLTDGDSAESLAAADRICSGGVAPDMLVTQLTAEVRRSLLALTCGREAPPVQRLGGMTDTGWNIAEHCGPEKLMRMAQILLGVQQHVRRGGDARLQLELACVRIASLGQVLDVEGLLRRIEKLEQQFSEHGGLVASPH